MKERPADKQYVKVDIRMAKTSSDWAAARALILEYVQWLNFDLSFQQFDTEMADLPKMYNEADGGIILAWMAQAPVGVVGLRRFSPSDAEVKRMFVKAEARKLGVGKSLLQKCIQLAGKLGYESIKLDTAAFMKPAISLYTDNGFVEIGAYRFNPYEHARYFEYRF